MIIKLYINNQRLDLYGDEDIFLNSSITNVSDISKNSTEYTKSFTVPATDNNNAIFKHFYDSNIDGGFDSRIKVSGHIELDGIPFKVGKFRLNGVSLKQGQPAYYNINFWGKLISFTDIFKKDKLVNVDLSAYDHSYDSDTVKTGLTTYLFDADLVYALFSPRQLYYNSNPTDATYNDTLANIAYNGQDVGITWNDLKPSLKLIRIIEAIENDYNVTFTRDFFGRAEFTNLYYYLSNSIESSGGDNQIVDFDGGDTTYINLTTNIGTYTTYGSNTSDLSVKFDYFLKVIPDSGFTSIPYTIKMYIDGEVFAEKDFNGGTKTLKSTPRFDGPTTYQVYFEVVSEQVFNYTASLLVYDIRQNAITQYKVFQTTTASSNTIDSNFIVSENILDIEIMEFITGLMKAFKLVIIPQDDGTIYVNTLKDYYASGNIYNITEYVDTSDVQVDRIDVLNPIDFKFKEPQTILQNQFKKNNSVYYGNLYSKLQDENGEDLDGSSYDIELPFEQLIYERLDDINDNEDTDVMYGGLFDEKLSPVLVENHIHYISLSVIGTKTIGYINDNGTISELNYAINIPSHSFGLESPNYSFIWGSEFNEWDGNIISKTLYSNYYSDYISNIYNKKNRKFKYRVKNFPLRLLTQISLNDILQIKRDYYRIDDFNLNLLKGDIEFNLVKSFDTTINPFYPDNTNIIVDFQIQTASVYVINGGDITTLKVDTGVGVTWFDVSDNLGLIEIDFLSENLTGLNRYAQIEVTNNVTLQEFTIDITQTPKRITADNNVITSDINLITADNN